MYCGEVSFEVGFHAPIEELLCLTAVEEDSFDAPVLPKEQVEII
jgi:hypothetical protein